MPPDAANFFLDPDGRAKAPEPVAVTTPQQVAAALHGLTLLQIAMIVSLCTMILGGAATTYMWTQGVGSAIEQLSFVLGIWRLSSIGMAIVELVALHLLWGAPPAARVAELARPALVVRTLGLTLSLASTGMPFLLRNFVDARKLTESFLFFGYAETVIGLVGTLFVIEILLRLRRFAAPNDRQLADNEGLVRAGLIGALVVRLVGHYTQRVLGHFLFGSGDPGQWLRFALQTMLSLLFFGLLLGLLQATISALRSYQPAAAAAGGDPLAAASAGAATRDNSAGYRNMLFGALWALGGLALTGLTYQNAHLLGGRYVISYGAIIAGAIQFIRGLMQLGGRRQ